MAVDLCYEISSCLYEKSDGICLGVRKLIFVDINLIRRINIFLLDFSIWVHINKKINQIKNMKCNKDDHGKIRGSFQK